MINHVWSVLCSRAVIDRDSNNVSIQNVIEQLTLRNLPKPGARINFPMELISLWVRAEPDKPIIGKARVSLKFPSGKIDNVSEYEIDLIQYERLRFRIQIEEFPLEDEGRYEFIVELGNANVEQQWEKVASIPLMIVYSVKEDE